MGSKLAVCCRSPFLAADPRSCAILQGLPIPGAAFSGDQSAVVGCGWEKFHSAAGKLSLDPTLWKS